MPQTGIEIPTLSQEIRLRTNNISTGRQKNKCYEELLFKGSRSSRASNIRLVIIDR